MRSAGARRVALVAAAVIVMENYLEHIAGTVRTLARHGVMSLLDFHQDMLNERFQDEGIPDWAVQDGGLPNPKLGFPANYAANPALEHALDAFWSNAPGPGGIGLHARFAAAWAHVAARFTGQPSLLGYELFNEPFPGTPWQPCSLPAGCPAFDAKLTSFNRRVDARIRKADRRTLVWYEPNVLFNSGTTISHVGAIGDRSAGFAFHNYCASQPAAVSERDCSKVFSNAIQHAAAVGGNALLLTEFGATDDAAYLREIVAHADRFMVPWLE